jgi:ABC-type nitrate/sulfonate/bicarbonate transport system substrate-binding protein
MGKGNRDRRQGGVKVDLEWEGASGKRESHGERAVLRWGNPPAGMYNVPIYFALAQSWVSAGEVRVAEHRNGPEYAEAVAGGRVDLGQMGSPVLLRLMERDPSVVIIGQACVVESPFVLLVRPGVDAQAGLVGRRIAINRRYSCPHTVLRGYLRSKGLLDESVEVELAGDNETMAQWVSEGRVDAVVWWEPFVSWLVKGLGWQVAARGEAVGGRRYYAFFLFARTEVLARWEGRVRYLCEAYWSAVEAIKREPGRGLQVARKYFPHIPEWVLRAALEEEARRWGHREGFLAGRLKESVEELVDLGHVERNFEWEDRVRLVV